MIKYGLPWYYYRIDENTFTGKLFLCVKKNHTICTFAILRIVTFSEYYSYSWDILKIISHKAVEKNFSSKKLYPFKNRFCEINYQKRDCCKWIFNWSIRNGGTPSIKVFWDCKTNLYL